MEKNPAKKESSWGKVADWYDALLGDEESYQAKVILPNLLRLADIKKGEHVLDLACGQGFFSRKFAEVGAKVSATDISEELIALAKKDAIANTNVEFSVSPSHALKFADKSFDLAVIVLALQNIELMQETLKECGRVLKPGGRLLIVLNHPAFRIPKRSSWGFDEDTNIQFRRLDAYMSESASKIDMHPGKLSAGKKSEQTFSFHRPLQSYVKALGKASLAVTRLEEWNSHKKSEKGKRSAAEDRARIEFPLFLCIEAKKV